MKRPAEVMDFAVGVAQVREVDLLMGILAPTPEAMSVRLAQTVAWLQRTTGTRARRWPLPPWTCAALPYVLLPARTSPRKRSKRGSPGCSIWDCPPHSTSFRK